MIAATDQHDFKCFNSSLQRPKTITRSKRKAIRIIINSTTLSKSFIVISNHRHDHNMQEVTMYRMWRIVRFWNESEYIENVYNDCHISIIILVTMFFLLFSVLLWFVFYVVKKKALEAKYTWTNNGFWILKKSIRPCLQWYFIEYIEYCYFEIYNAP